MRAVHFGAGNIGRGFIGEILAKNDFTIDFVDINETIIDALNDRKEYTIEIADEEKEKIHVTGVDGINNKNEPEKVIQAIAKADIITTAIGPKILPFIAELIAKGIQQRIQEKNTAPIDVIACENMIGGSHFLFEKVCRYLSESELDYVEQYVGFPNAAVDRIVPIQQHEDPLFVSVEPFCEWVVDASQMKAESIRLAEVEYVEDLEPYIERKLFSVNTGHATTAYTGDYYGYDTIDQAIADDRVLNQLQRVLEETGALLIDKWGFDPEVHQAYTEKIIQRFKNVYISDAIHRVARTPIRKLGYNERFIRPIREAKDHGVGYDSLIDTAAMVLRYNDPEDQESVTLQEMLQQKPLREVIEEVTELKDLELIDQLIASYEQSAYV